MYDPARGTVRIAGIDLRDTSAAHLHRRVAVVPQEVQLFPASLRDNLTLYNPQISDDALRDAIEQFALADWLRGLPAGLDTLLDGTGEGLSAGQSQLLAACRVLLHDPGVVILDEISARLDLATERQIDAAITTLLRDRTGIIIAHRPQTLARADEILILDSGRMVDFGPASELRVDAAGCLPGREPAIHPARETPA
jgi:ABC-type multidrug transport system fused ATPase/permease subunit